MLKKVVYNYFVFVLIISKLDLYYAHFETEQVYSDDVINGAENSEMLHGEVNDMFKRVDPDGDGKITKKAYITLMKDLIFGTDRDDEDDGKFDINKIQRKLIGSLAEDFVNVHYPSEDEIELTNVMEELENEKLMLYIEANYKEKLENFQFGGGHDAEYEEDEGHDDVNLDEFDLDNEDDDETYTTDGTHDTGKGEPHPYNNENADGDDEEVKAHDEQGDL